MGSLLGITGTPGTGKKTLAPLVAGALGLPCVDLNQLLSPGERKASSAGVDPAKLRKRLLRLGRSRAIVFGHLLPDVLARSDVRRVVVLRCDPSVLRRRLRQRSYPAGKVAENVEAELIGLISASCLSKFGQERVAEFDTTSVSVARSARSVARLFRAPGVHRNGLDWLPSYSSAEKLWSLLSEARTDSAFT